MKIHVAYIAQQGFKQHAVYDFGHGQYAPTTLCGRPTDGEIGDLDATRLCIVCARAMNQRDAEETAIDYLSVLADALLTDLVSLKVGTYWISEVLTQHCAYLRQLKRSWELGKSYRKAVRETRA